jgi:hypothetical protein
MTDATTHCHNCGTPLAGHYCHECGQKRGAARFTFARLLHEIPHAILHVDRGLPATLRALARHPGRTINDYLDGRRVRYFNPLTLLVLMAGLTAFAYSSYPFEYAALNTNLTASLGAKYAEFGRLNFRFYSLTLLLYLPAATVINWVCFAGMEPSRNRNFGEHLIVNAYVFGFFTLLMLLAFPFYALANGGPWFAWVWSLAGLFIVAYHAVMLYATFHTPGKSASTLLRAVVAVLVYLTMVTLGPIVFFFTVYVKYF